MDFNNIAELLRSGVDPSEIAEAFTTTLNEEIEAYDQELNEIEECASPLDFDYSEWDFEDLSELLAFAWNKTVLAYAHENGYTDIEDFLITDVEARKVVEFLVTLYTSSVTKSLMRVFDNAKVTVKKIPEEVKKQCACRRQEPPQTSATASISFDELDKLVESFLRNK